MLTDRPTKALDTLLAYSFAVFFCLIESDVTHGICQRSRRRRRRLMFYLSQIEEARARRRERHRCRTTKKKGVSGVSGRRAPFSLTQLLIREIRARG